MAIRVAPGQPEPRRLAREPAKRSPVGSSLGMLPRHHPGEFIPEDQRRFLQPEPWSRVALPILNLDPNAAVGRRGIIEHEA